MTQYVVLSECVWTNEHTIRGTDDHVKTTFHTEHGPIYAIGRIGHLHELGCYTLEGVFDKSYKQRSLDTINIRPFKIHSAIFRKREVSKDSLIRVGALISKIDTHFMSRKWQGMVRTWDLFDDNYEQSKYYEDVIHPKIKFYASKHPSLSFWVDAEDYTFVYSLYDENMDIFNWTKDTIETIMYVYSIEPYTLCYKCPTEDINGCLVSLDTLETHLGEERTNEFKRESVLVADMWLGDSSKCIKVDDVVSPQGAEELLSCGFLTQYGDYYLQTKFSNVFMNLKEANKIICDTFEDMNVRCRELLQEFDGNVSFVVSQRQLFDRTAYSVPVETLNQTMGTNIEHAVILHAETWTLGEMMQVLDIVGGQQFLTMLGISTFEKNRLGYNFFHYFQETCPVATKQFEFEKFNAKKINSSKRFFTYDLNKTAKFQFLVRSLLDTFSQRGRNKMRQTFVCDDPHMRHKIKLALQSITKNNLYSIHDRVILNNREALFVHDIYDVSLASNNPNKRKRKCKTTADDFSKSKSKRMIKFNTDLESSYRSMEYKMSHWSVMTVDEARTLKEDTVFLFSDTATTSLIQMFAANATRLVWVRNEGVTSVPCSGETEIPDAIKLLLQEI